jgi:hypothetical protein
LITSLQKSLLISLYDCPECVEEDEIPHGAAVFNILIMGYGGGVLNRATRAAMMAVEAIKNKTP